MRMRLRASSICRWQRWLPLVLRVWFNATVLGMGLLVSGLSWDPVAQAGSVSYVYDDLGRLLAVVNGTTGQAAIYQYDAVGNLLGITTQAASAISILNFTPKSGPVGTAVTISGTGFSATANQNTVKFNGTTATVTSATTTQLVVTVPTGATTGPISITVGLASATSTTSFSVTTSATQGAPTITSFTPTIGMLGTPITINGANFEATPADNWVHFNTALADVASATTSVLTTAVPPWTGSGHIAVTTSRGQATASNYFFFVPPPFTPADVLLTDQMAFGDTKTVTINTANKIALILFEAAFHQRFSVKMTNLMVNGAPSSNLGTIYYVDSTGFVYTSSAISFEGEISGPRTVTAGGTQTMVVDPAGTNVGSVTLTLYDVPPDPVVPIIPNGPPATVTNTAPGQGSRFTFSGTAGQRVSLIENTTVSCGPGGVALLNPDGTVLSSFGLCSNQWIEPQTLPQTGIYTFFIDNAYLTGSTTFTLYDVPPDITGPITPDGAPVTFTNTAPGQNGKLTFTGTAGQRVAVQISSVTGFLGAYLWLYKPDGTNLGNPVCLCNFSFFDTVTLPVTGTYTLLLDPGAAEIGQATVKLITVPPDLASTITSNGASVPLSLAAGQNANVTFSGTAGQSVSLGVSSVTIGDPNTGLQVGVLNPDGVSLVLPMTSIPAAGQAFDLQLPATGVYTIVVDPTGLAPDSLTLTLSPDQTGTLTLGSASVLVTLNRPGQNARRTFTTTQANQQVTVRITHSTIPGITVSLRNASGAVLTSTTSNTAGFNLAQQTLSTVGTYTVFIDPPGISTGTLKVQVTSP